MPVIAVTRLRLRDHALLNDFFTAAVAALEQAKKSAGHLGSDALADANDAWWTVTAWAQRDPMRAFVDAQPHLGTMPHLDEWCDEATFVDWEQDSADLPDWQSCYQRLIAGGQVATLSHPSPEHATRAFPPPVEPAAT
jgi:hypothetical protein